MLCSEDGSNDELTALDFKVVGKRQPETANKRQVKIEIKKMD